jgi:hypothetical protein
MFRKFRASVASRNQGPAGGHAGGVAVECRCHPTILLCFSTGNSHPTHSTGWQFHPMIESKAKIVSRYSYAERLIFSLQPIASAIDLSVVRDRR